MVELEEVVVDCGEGKAVPPHVRTLCWGGPCDGQVMYAPLFTPPSWWLQTAVCVTFPGGLYGLRRATREQVQTGRELFTILGEPHHGYGAWVWAPGSTPADIEAGPYDGLIQVTHRKVRIFALSNYDDGAFLAAL